MRKLSVKIFVLLIAGLYLAAACGPADTPTTSEDIAIEEPIEAGQENTDNEPAPLVESATEAIAVEESNKMTIQSQEVEIISDGDSFVSYLAAPQEGGPFPGIVLVHSFNGMEPGYRTMTDEFAAEGFVVLAVGWQTFERGPGDATIEQLMQDSVAFLQARDDVDVENLGLTGFCAGGRYTMLFLPQLEVFDAGVAWYGFPYGGETRPADLISDLASPMLIIHGTADRPSPIEDIYRYTEALEEAGKTFELKVYDDEPHGFMLDNGQLRDDDVADDAFEQMISFFQRELG